MSTRRMSPPSLIRQRRFPTTRAPQQHHSTFSSSCSASLSTRTSSKTLLLMTVFPPGSSSLGSHSFRLLAERLLRLHQASSQSPALQCRPEGQSLRLQAVLLLGGHPHECTTNLGLVYHSPSLPMGRTSYVYISSKDDPQLTSSMLPQSVINPNPVFLYSLYILLSMVRAGPSLASTRLLRNSRRTLLLYKTTTISSPCSLSWKEIFMPF